MRIKKWMIIALALAVPMLMAACGRNNEEAEKAEDETGASYSQEALKAVSEAAKAGRAVLMGALETGSSRIKEEAEKVRKEAFRAQVKEMEAGTVLSEEDLEGIDTGKLFTSEEIPDRVFERMEGVSFGQGCVTPRDQLRYLRVLHKDFNGDTCIGEIVCNRDIAEDLIYIFRELYKADYPIEKIRLVDDYDGDDELSMEDNNTSCFNFRPVAGTGHLSKHAYGRAIDINPLYNPYITSSGYTPVNAGDYVDRSAENPYKIDEEDLCYRLFRERGFIWGGSGNSVKDYQHFQKSE